jgi:hypothetical protein
VRWNGINHPHQRFADLSSFFHGFTIHCSEAGDYCHARSAHPKNQERRRYCSHAYRDFSRDADAQRSGQHVDLRHDRPRSPQIAAESRSSRAGGQKLLGRFDSGQRFCNGAPAAAVKVAKSVPISKAIFLVAESEKHERLPGGRKAPSNFDTIRKFWDEYRSVAHLWAAYCLLKEDGTLPFQGEKQLTDREQATRCIDFLMCADCMLNTAEKYRFDFHADPWRVPASFPRRPATFPGIAPPDDWIRATLAQYRPRT